VHEAIAACRDSGRTPVVVGRQPADAVSAWLGRFSLADQVRYVAAGQPGRPRTAGQLIDDAVRSLGSATAACAVITTSGEVIGAARAMGVHAIGHAASAGSAESLSAAGAEAVVPSLADLTLRLRARPLL